MARQLISLHLEDAVRRVSAVADLRLRRVYMRALSESMALDLDDLDHPRVASPSALLTRHGIAVDQQREYGIAVTKKDCLRYLTLDCGMKGLKQGRINRTLAVKNYRRMFRRRPSRLNRKTLVFSLAEVQHLMQHTFQNGLPSEMIETPR